MTSSKLGAAPTVRIAIPSSSGSSAASDDRGLDAWEAVAALEKVRGQMARPKRFELLTPRFVVWCSIQLSYGRAARSGGKRRPERMAASSFFRGRRQGPKFVACGGSAKSPRMARRSWQGGDVEVTSFRGRVARDDQDRRSVSPRLSQKVAMIRRSIAPRKLIVTTPRTKRSTHFIAHPQVLDLPFGPKPGSPTKPVVLVRDKGPIHVSKASRAALAERAHWFIVEWLAKYGRPESQTSRSSSLYRYRDARRRYPRRRRRLKTPAKSRSVGTAEK